jgi:hypothetical protein
LSTKSAYGVWRRATADVALLPLALLPSLLLALWRHPTP